MRMSFAHSFIAKMENGPHRQTYVKSNDPIAFYAMQLYILQWHLQEYIQFFFGTNVNECIKRIAYLILNTISVILCNFNGKLFLRNSEMVNTRNFFPTL